MWVKLVPSLRSLCRSFSFAPSGLADFRPPPTAYAVGCILSPLRGLERAVSSTVSRHDQATTQTPPGLSCGVQGSFDFAQEDRANCNAETHCCFCSNVFCSNVAIRDGDGVLCAWRNTRACADTGTWHADLNFSQSTQEMGHPAASLGEPGDRRASPRDRVGDPVPHEWGGNFNSHFWGDL